MPGHDAFFSFSHADDEAYGDFVRQFRDMLRKRVAARLKLAYPKLEFVTDTLDFFVDWEGFPANGPMWEALEHHVQQSQFLFLLVGKGYLQSDYCQKEREWFRAAFNENEKTALSRTFLVFLTSEALTIASEGDIGALRSEVFWKDTCGERPNRPMPPYLPKDG